MSKCEKDIVNEFLALVLPIRYNNLPMSSNRIMILSCSYNRAIYKFRKHKLEIFSSFMDEKGFIFNDFGNLWNWKNIVDNIYNEYNLYYSINVNKYSSNKL